MDTVQTFLDDIVANPHDDAPRLVLADWLEDNADTLPAADRRQWLDRAAFIRVQYALEGMAKDDPRRPALEARQALLLQTHRKVWDDGLITTAWGPPPPYRRGFIEEVEGTGDVTQSPRWGRAPVRRLRLAGYYEQVTPRERAAVEQNAGFDRLAQVDDLDLSTCSFPDRELAIMVLHSPRLTRLRSLAVQAGSFALVALITAPCLARLTSLALHPPYLRTSREALSALASSPRWSAPVLEELALHAGPNLHYRPQVAALHAPALRRLAIYGQALPRAKVKALFTAQPAFAASVEELELSGVRDVALVGRDNPMPRLRRLVVNGGSINGYLLGDGGQSSFPALRALNLRNIRPVEQGIDRLTASRQLGELESLHLPNTGIGHREVVGLLTQVSDRLRSLDLSWNAVGSDAVGRLASSPAAGSLQALNLSFCALPTGAASHLANLPADAPLHTLTLGTNRLDDDDLALLLDAPGLQRLDALDVTNNALTDRSVDPLLASPLLHNLSFLAISGNRISPRAQQRLQEHFRGMLL